jgi:predicted AAA+ superfamily ATPase
MMYSRRLIADLVDRLDYMPAVALLGARQVGKTTLADQMAETRPSIYLDLESPRDREKLSDPEFYLASHEDKLVVLDEIQRVPELFQVLRGLIDQGRKRGKTAGRFLLLGSASAEWLRQSETLAGRISYLELSPLDVMELEPTDQRTLWVRGGFPDSFLARTEARSLEWRNSFIRTYLERDIPQLVPRIPSTTLRRFWTMLAHNQGGLFNAAEIGRSLAMDGKTISRYLDLLVNLMLVRRLQPYYANTGKRLVKTPKVYVRDSGVLHALLGIPDHEELMGHPVAGASWEGFAIQNLLAVAPEQVSAAFYRTSSGAEIDLLLEVPGEGLWAIEVKLGLQAKPRRGFHEACKDLQPVRRFVVNSGTERYPIAPDVEAIGLRELAGLLAATAKSPHLAAGGLSL